VLLAHTSDGHLFSVDDVGPLFGTAADTVDRRQPMPQASPMADGNVERLRRSVTTIWVDGVLNKSFLQTRRIDLSASMDQGAVTGGGWEAIDAASRTSVAMAPGACLSDLFEEQGRSLLILGEPGAGKSTAMLELLRDLVEREPTGKVPVVFLLSTWSSEPLDQWMVSELAKNYNVPKSVGRQLIAQRALVPLLDGLDEVPSDRRESCVRAINDFAASPLWSGSAVACREKEYRALEDKLQLNAAMRIGELTRDQVLEYDGQCGDRLAALHSWLLRDVELLADARTPLMLRLMTLAFDGMPMTELEHGDHARSRRERVMAAYVSWCFKRQQRSGANRHIGPSQREQEPARG
jgi:hypothetical protein